eukprot:1213818-Amphidinium_carterae.1
MLLEERKSVRAIERRRGALAAEPAERTSCLWDTLSLSPDRVHFRKSPPPSGRGAVPPSGCL